MSETEQHVEIPDPYAIALDEIDVMDPRLFHEDKHWRYFERLRQEDPVHLSEREHAGRFWSITKFDDIMAIDTNHRLFSSAHGIALGPRVDLNSHAERGAFNMFISMDPPKHDEQRATVSPVVAPPNLKLLESTIRERAGTILDGLPIGETFNWVDNVSVELTTQMLATLFDFPFEDRRKLTRWSDVVTAGQEEGIVESREEGRQEMLSCLEYFTRLWQERVGKPGNDLVSMLANGEATKDMQPYEFLGNLLLLIVGGNDTTRNSITGGVLALNENPGEYEKLRADHGLAPNMVSEIIRWQSPIAYMRRTANDDCEVRDKQILKGDQLLMWYISGNRDEDVIPNANQFQVDRPNARHHLAFGFGIHRCMGNRMAEMQLRVLWEEILKRFETVEVVGEARRNYSTFIHGFRELPVRVHPL